MEVSDLKEQQPGPDLSTPSKVEEAPPTLVRNIGLAGSVFFAVGLLLWLWNLISFPYEGGKGPPADPLFIRLWLLFGTLALAIHALRERDERLRRFYGLFSLGLLSFGGLFLCYTLTAEGLRLHWTEGSLDLAIQEKAATAGRWWALVGTSLLAILLYFFSVAPFVAACQEEEGKGPLNPLNYISGWLTSLRGDMRVVALALALLQAFLVCVCFLLFAPLRELLKKEMAESVLADETSLLVFGLMPLGVWSLLLGLLFQVLFQQAEDDEAWRGVGLAVCGWLGTVAALAAMAGVGADLIGLKNLVMPFCLILGTLGFLLLWLFLQQTPPESELGYRAGWWLRLAGLAVFLFAAGRSLYPVIAENFLGRESITPYLVPSGFLMMALGLAFAWLGHAKASQGKLIAMVNRELASYFYSPIGYVVLGGMVVIAWISYFTWVTILQFSRMQTIPEPIVSDYLYGLFPVVALIVIVPMLTMRLLSEEQRSGTMEVLLTAPVDETQIVLSKFLGSWLMFMLCWLVWLLFPLIFRAATAEPFDYRPFLSFYLGMCLMSAAFLSLGLFFSSLTKNQIIAFLLALAGMLALLAPGFFATAQVVGEGPFLETLKLVSFIVHYGEFTRGQLQLKYVIFYLSFTVFWLFLTVKVLEARKWK